MNVHVSCQAVYIGMQLADMCDCYCLSVDIIDVQGQI